MKIYYKAQGNGNLLAKDPETGKRVTIKAGVNNVSDALAEDMMRKYPKVISTDEEARELKAKSAVTGSELAELKAENKALKEQVEKLKLIAVEAPSDGLKEYQKEAGARIAELEELVTKERTEKEAKDARIAELEKLVKEYEELINADKPTPAAPSVPDSAS